MGRESREIIHRELEKLEEAQESFVFLDFKGNEYDFPESRIGASQLELIVGATQMIIAVVQHSQQEGHDLDAEELLDMFKEDVLEQLNK